jgi:sugar phosphate isomerase/epimerase
MMNPQIAICNIYDQDTEKLAEFASRNGFSFIDWSIDPLLPEREFLSRMKRLEAFQLRYHCRFHGVDLAYTDQRGDHSLDLLMRTVNQVAQAGGRHMTVHSGLGNPAGQGIDLFRAIDNLSVLVEHGNRNGVAVALENLTTPLTNDPLQFHRIVSESGAYVTVDIGHAHAVGSASSRSEILGNYVLPHQDRILNAHVYHTELDGYGHVPPGCLSDIDNRLDLLGTAPCCDWWVIELMAPAELLYTRDLLLEYLAALPLQTETALRDNPLPLAAA